MANQKVSSQITFEGLKYNLDNRDRIAAQAATSTDFSALPTSEPTTSGSLWISGSTTGADSSGFLVVSKLGQ